MEDYSKIAPTKKQVKIIKFIEVNLGIKFEGKSTQDAYDFIGKYHEEANDHYKFKGKAEHVRKAKRAEAAVQEWSDYYERIGAVPSDYGVPNH